MDLSSVLKSNLRKILKASNQRIVQLDKDFGWNSATSKNATSFLEKGATVKYKGLSASGHVKIDIPKLIKDIENGSLSESEANAILVPATGQRLKDGELLDVGPGITTKTRERMKYERDYDTEGMTEEEIIDDINERNDIYNDFQTAYDDFSSALTLKERKKEMPELYKKKGKGKKYTREEMERDAERMREIRKNYKKTRKKEIKNGQDINNQLKNGI